MTLDDPPAPTRRSHRAATGAIPITTDAVPTETPDVPIASDDVEPGTVGPLAETPTTSPAATDADTAPVKKPRKKAPVTHTALLWVDEARVAAPSSPRDSAGPVEPDLLAHAPRRNPLRPSVSLPFLIAFGTAAVYVIAMLLWPLYAVTPTITGFTVQPVAAAPAALPWPAAGSASVTVANAGDILASSDQALPIASITKVVTALVVLDALPLSPGEQGPNYSFSSRDRVAYWGYLNRGESALDVPAGGSLTEYQMLQGMLIGSANNYADRLVSDLWPTDAVFAQAARAWMNDHGVPGITIYEPTGMDARNAASPAALITLAEKAMADPVIAEIVGTRSVVLPGAGEVENTNDLLADAGVAGIKTGTLDEWNLLSAKDVTIAGTAVRLYASVLGQPDNDARVAASRALYAQLEAELQPKPSVTGATVTGVVDTAWGQQVNIVSAGDASVVLWNGASGTVATTYDLGESRTKGDKVGVLTVTGPLDAAQVDLTLDGTIEEPTAMWRLTHPLELLGLTE